MQMGVMAGITLLLATNYNANLLFSISQLRTNLFKTCTSQRPSRVPHNRKKARKFFLLAHTCKNDINSQIYAEIYIRYTGIKDLCDKTSPIFRGMRSRAHALMMTSNNCKSFLEVLAPVQEQLSSYPAKVSSLQTRTLRLQPEPSC